MRTKTELKEIGVRQRAAFENVDALCRRFGYDTQDTGLVPLPQGQKDFQKKVVSLLAWRR